MKILIAPFGKKMQPDWKGAPEVNPKNYPYFKELLELLKDHEIIQIGIDGEEELVKDFRKNLTIQQLDDLIKEVDLFISVDSFLPHLAHHLNKKGIVLWGQSDPLIFGYPEHTNLLKSRNNLREQQFWRWEQAQYKPEVFVAPEAVKEVVDKWDKK